MMGKEQIKPNKTVKTNLQKGSTTPVPYERKVRLLLWGGAIRDSDNGAFRWAAKNVQKDYETIDHGNYVYENIQIKTATNIISHIQRQKNNSIRSLDIFTHGGTYELDMNTGSSDQWFITRFLFYDANLYSTRWTRFNAPSLFILRGDSELISAINFAKFTENTKIEFHGCDTAEADSGNDNIAAEFSKLLYEAGKKKSVVIGHAEESGPSIKGAATTIQEQDYRHGKRAVFSNGKRVFETQKKKYLDERELEGMTK